MTLSELRREYRFGPYAWPGGYPRYALCADGGCLCWECLKSARRQVIAAVARPEFQDRQWQVVAIDINWESPDLYCDHCGERIESAYADMEPSLAPYRE